MLLPTAPAMGRHLKLRSKSLITGVKPLSQWKEAFEMVESCQAVKMLLTPED
jgi:hypothetical protein